MGMLRQINVLLFAQAREIVKANNLDDKVVVVHGRVEVRFCIYVFFGYMYSLNP
jgi:hypothetical protein